MPLKYIRGIFFITGFLFSLSLYANVKDSTKTPTDSLATFFFFSRDFGHLKPGKYLPVDTMLTGFQKYDPANELYPMHTSLGNLGLANKSMVFNHSLTPGFDLGNHNFDSYLFINENLKYYKSESPFSDMFYLMGAKKEQYLNAIHSRNLSKNLTIGIKYRLIRSLGYYKWQQSSNTNAALTSYYTTTNKRYGFIANFVFNRLLSYENGGVFPDSIKQFEDNLISRDIVTVNMIADQKRYNNFRESSFYLKHYYFLGLNKKIKLTDTTEENVFHGLGTITHTVKFDRQSIFYDDNGPKSGFYNNILIDSTYTYDSLHYKVLENKISFSNENNEFIGNQYFLIYNLGFTHQLINIAQTVYRPFSPFPDTSSKIDTTITTLLDTTFQQYIVDAELKTDPEKIISLAINGYKIFGGYNNKDFGLNAYSMINFSDSIRSDNFILLKAGYNEKETPWLNQRYYSNHFNWHNYFLKTKTIYTAINWTYKTLSTSLNYYIIDNMVYYDTLIKPQQYSHTANIVNLTVSKNFRWKNWSLDNTLIYQKVLIGDSVLHFPELILNNSLYYNGRFFKGALYSQFGLELNYNSSYYSDAYVPGIREFYLQNSLKTGNYPYVDVFLNFKIKRVRFFLKYQHINQGLSGFRYYTTPYYPLQDRAWKFGLSWIFHS